MRVIENSLLYFFDMKIMLQRNGGNSVNNECAGRVVYRINAIPK